MQFELPVTRILEFSPALLLMYLMELEDDAVWVKEEMEDTEDIFDNKFETQSQCKDRG